MCRRCRCSGRWLRPVAELRYLREPLPSRKYLCPYIGVAIHVAVPAELLEPVLIHRPIPEAESGRKKLEFQHAVKVALMPFTWEAWLLIVGIILASKA